MIEIKFISGPSSANFSEETKVLKISSNTTLKELFGDRTGATLTGEIIKEKDGFYLKHNKDKISIPIQNTRFFLQQGIILSLGDIVMPERRLRVSKLNYPRLRVNFNGFRLKTLKVDLNCSTTYVINDDIEEGIYLELEDEDKHSTITFNSENERYDIGGAPESYIKLEKTEFEGAIRYIEDTGWVIKGDSKEIDNYGIYLHYTHLKDIEEIKLYEGMKFTLNENIFQVIKVR